MGEKGGKTKAKKGEFSKERREHEHFHPFLFDNRSLEMLDEKEVEEAKVEIEEKFLDSLKVINEEALQLSEFLIEDKKLAKELCRLIKPILKHLNISFPIPSRAIPIPEKSDQIILNEDGHLIFT